MAKQVEPAPSRPVTVLGNGKNAGAMIGRRSADSIEARGKNFLTQKPDT